jgi:hypothetical protein
MNQRTGYIIQQMRNGARLYRHHASSDAELRFPDGRTENVEGPTFDALVAQAQIRQEPDFGYYVLA